MESQELLYNHIMIVENETCIEDNGLYCLEWVNTKDIALPMSFFVLFGLSIMTLVIIYSFIKRK